VPATWRACVPRGVGYGRLPRSSLSLGSIPIPRVMRSSTPSSKQSTGHEIGIEIGIVPESEPILVDTDVASALYLERYYGRRVPASLAGTLATRRLAISVISLGEAHYGARKRKWGPPRTMRMLTFYREMFDVVSLVDDDTAAAYGYLRARTESVGQPIADNDLWIAVCATANGLALATLNRRHFEPLTISGLTLL
jgi:predicted nucleic acid-binding protein